MHNLYFVQWSNDFGGLERITKDLEIRFKDYHPCVILLLYKPQGIQYNDFKFFRWSNKIQFVFRYIRFINKRKDKIFHLQLVGTAILFLTYLAGARKIIYHFHGTYSTKNYFQRLIWKFLENKITMIANSEYTRNEINIKYRVSKNIVTIPNLIDENKFKFVQRKGYNEVFEIVYAGRLARGKNIPLILDSLKVLKDKGIAVKANIYGDGSEKENLFRKIDELGIGDIVKINPFTNNISDIYSRSHLFLFASLFETFGNVVAEAILSGLPVLCYKIPSLSEFIKDDTFFFESKNPELVAQKIIWFRDNYSSANEKLKCVHDYLKEYLDNNRIINQIKDIYKELELKK